MKTKHFSSLFQLTSLAGLLISYPFAFSHASAPAVRMNIEILKKEAFSQCQKQHSPPAFVPVPILDPPASGGPEAVGMVFQEELSVRTRNSFDERGFYFVPRPRAAVNWIPMNLYVQQSQESYVPVTWEDANPDYSSNLIRPPIRPEEIPEAGRVLTELIIGQKAPDGGYPQMFDIRSSAYVRFAGFPPQVTGATLRLGAHNIFSLSGGKEDFPVIRSLYVGLRNDKTTQALALVENELFCGALIMDMTGGDNSEIIVDGYWYFRRDFDWQKEPHTSFVAYSSMAWKTEKQTPERLTDEAHDSDVVYVQSASSPLARYPIDPPPASLRIRDLTPQALKEPVRGWFIANEDRNPHHYADFAPALQSTNYQFRAGYRVEILESTVATGVSLYEEATNGEYADNIVAASTLRQNIKRSKSFQDYIRFKYRTTSSW